MMTAGVVEIMHMIDFINIVFSEDAAYKRDTHFVEIL